MKNTIYLLGLLFLIAGCKTIQLSSTPSPGVSDSLPEVKESKIFVPIEINLSDVEKEVEQNVPTGRIYRKNVGCEREEYKVEVFRNNPMKVSSSNGKLIFTTNLKVKADGSYCAGVWTDNWLCSCCCAGAHPSGSANSTVAVKIEVDLKVNENYDITAKTKVDGKIIDGKHVKIPLLGFTISIPVEDIAGPIKDKLKPIAKQLDKEIAKQLNQINLKEELTKTWNESHKVIPADSNFFLHIYPQNVFFQNITSSGNKINLGVGIGVKLNLKTDRENIEIKPLPNLTITEPQDGFFHINLPTDASFAKISSELNDQFVGEKYEYGNNWVKIKDVQLYGVKINENASGLLIDVEIKGKVSAFKRVKGHLYFTTKPALDIEKQIVYLDDFKMNSNTNSELINKGVEFLINKFYYEDISNSTMYDYSNDIKGLEEKIKAELKLIKLDDIDVNLTLENINLNGIYITDEVLGIDAEAKGQIQTVRIK